MTQPVKRERAITTTTTATTTLQNDEDVRLLYRPVKKAIIDEAEDIASVDSDKFNSVINKIESLHQFVQSPREQIIDAEALLGITNSLVSGVKAHCNDGITVSEFVTSLLRNFGRQSSGGASTSSAVGGRDLLLDWHSVGVKAAGVFRSFAGCQTMIGPMDTELKRRKVTLRKRSKPTERTRPEKVDELAGERSDTDINMATMFNILRKKRSVKLENLVLNRNSFAQTVENLFTLSFLVKDGRAEIEVNNENGWHLVSPRNAASANAVAAGEAVYRHFVFRFDFKDWKLMKSVVGVGEELMPDRGAVKSSYDNQQESASMESQEAGPNTPIRKLSRNRGLVLQEEKIVEENSSSSSSPPEADSAQPSTVVAGRKRKHRVS